ncbi:hypothetical protein ACFVAJ_19385 [Agromyces sp. NPDC057679]|uniref:hypothetical protein n=1 Tax=Agromyces sp. NPDC057679 TaxID=3346207 RepID=UPI00366DCEE4
MSTTTVTTTATISKVIELPNNATVTFTLAGPAAKAFADWADTYAHVKVKSVNRTSGEFKTKAGHLRGLGHRLMTVGYSIEEAHPAVRVSKKAAKELRRHALADAFDEARSSALLFVPDDFELGAAHVDEEYAAIGNVWVRPNKKPATVKVVASIVVTSNIAPTQ